MYIYVSVAMVNTLLVREFVMHSKNEHFQIVDICNSTACEYLGKPKNLL